MTQINEALIHAITTTALQYDFYKSARFFFLLAIGIGFGWGCVEARFEAFVILVSKF